MTAEAPLFENRDWTVSPGGIEHKDTGYFIGRDQVGDRRGDGLWSWPIHMAEKSWVRPASFRQAFMGALQAFAVAVDPALADSFALADQPGADRGSWLPLAGPDAIRVRPEGPGLAEEPDLPAWARPHPTAPHALIAAGL